MRRSTSASRRAPDQLANNCEALGWDIAPFVSRGLVHVMQVSPSELDLDRHAFVIRERTREVGARIVVIDSVSAFDTERKDGAAVSDYLWAIADHFRRDGVTLILTTEAYSFFEGGGKPERHMSYLADAVLLLRLVEIDDDVKRRISVMKMRGSHHDTRIRELQIGSDRVEVAPHD